MPAEPEEKYGPDPKRGELPKRIPATHEFIFLAREDLSKAEVEALAAFATSVIEANNGSVTRLETWGLKSLAYKIGRSRKAHFVMLDIDGPKAAVKELERQIDRDERIIRYMAIDIVDHEDGPSVMTRKTEERMPRDTENDEDLNTSIDTIQKLTKMHQPQGTEAIQHTLSKLGRECRKIEEAQSLYRQELEAAVAEGERLLKKALG